MEHAGRKKIFFPGSMTAGNSLTYRYSNLPNKRAPWLESKNLLSEHSVISEHLDIYTKVYEFHCGKKVKIDHFYS